MLRSPFSGAMFGNTGLCWFTGVGCPSGHWVLPYPHHHQKMSRWGARRKEGNSGTCNQGARSVGVIKGARVCWGNSYDLISVPEKWPGDKYGDQVQNMNVGRAGAFPDSGQTPHTSIQSGKGQENLLGSGATTTRPFQRSGYISTC